MDGGSFHSATRAVEQFHKEIGPKKGCCLFGFGVVPSGHCESLLDQFLCDPQIQEDEARGCAHYKICDVMRREWQTNSFRAASQIFCLQTTKNIYIFARNIALKIHTKRRVERTTGMPECQESVRVSYGGFTHEDGHTESIITYEYLDKLEGKVYESDSLEEGYEMPDDIKDSDHLQYNVLPLDAPLSMIVVDMVTAKKKKDVLGDLTTKDLKSYTAPQIKNELYIEGHHEQVIYVQHMRPAKPRKSKGDLTLDLPVGMDAATARDAEKVVKQMTSTESTLTPLYVGYTPTNEMEAQMTNENYSNRPRIDRSSRMQPLVLETAGEENMETEPTLEISANMPATGPFTEQNKHMHIDHANHTVTTFNEQVNARLAAQGYQASPESDGPKFKTFYESRLVMEPASAAVLATSGLGDAGEPEKESPTMIMPYVDFEEFSKRYKGSGISAPSSRTGSRKVRKLP